MEVITIVTTVISLIQTVLPLLGKTGAVNAGAVGGILGALQTIAPLVTQAIGEVPTIYTGVKNIIHALKSDPSTLPDQMKALHAYEAALDAAWNDAADAIDPDAPGAA